MQKPTVLLLAKDFCHVNKNVRSFNMIKVKNELLTRYLCLDLRTHPLSTNSTHLYTFFIHIVDL